jgi:surface antigen/uncharacterized protein YukE
MATILVRPPELRQISEQMRSNAQKIDDALKSIDREMGVLKGHSFLGNRADSLQSRYHPKRDALLKAKELVIRFSENLKMAADVFEKADNGIGNNAYLNTGGAILGTKSTKNRTRFSDLLSEEVELRKKYEQWMEKYGNEIDGWSLEKVEKALLDIQRAIEDLESGIKDMKYPKDIRLWLLNILTDIDDKYIANSQKNIEKLNQLVVVFNERRELLIEKIEMENRLADVKDKIIEISTNSVIPESTTPSWLQKHLGGCTHYVAGRRDISTFGNGHPGNAAQWDDQARAAGYETGVLPMKGSIIVYEGNLDPDGAGPIRRTNSAGHVGYVESVTRVDGGYQVVYSQADTIYGSEYMGGWK